MIGAGCFAIVSRAQEDASGERSAGQQAVTSTVRIDRLVSPPPLHC
jgi:hypothetical protein